MGITYCKQCRSRISIEWEQGSLVTECSECAPAPVVEEYRNLDVSNTRPVWATVFVAVAPLASIVAIALALARTMAR